VVGTKLGTVRVHTLQDKGPAIGPRAELALGKEPRCHSPALTDAIDKGTFRPLG
jgi:hypothetical protein